MRVILILLSILFFQISYSCPVGNVGLSRAEFKRLKAAGKKHHGHRQISSATPATLPTASSDQPWGGKDAKAWHPEAILANAASQGLTAGWNMKDATEVLVSVPVKMIFTNERVYGDGQTNASLQFGTGWNQDHPPLVATLVKYKNGERRVSFAFSSTIQFSSSKVNIISFTQDPSGKVSQHQESLEIKKQSTVNVAEWSVPSQVRFGDLNASRVVWVQPNGWDSAFPIDFRISVYSNQKLLASAADAKTAGKSPLDPMDIFGRAQKAQENPQRTLLTTTYGPEWKKDPLSGINALRNDSIHGEIHVGGKEIKNAVGGGLTWLVDRGPDSRFKNLYTCFDPRNFEKESQYGVPSGGGWHEIGDAAETIINDVEATPVLVGFATGLPWPTPPNNAKFAWGLSDVATMRLLMPGEGIVTAAGDQTWKEDTTNRSTRGTETSGGGRNYHWFAFNADEPTCTQEWVHNCRPTEQNNLGLSCL